MTTQLENLHWSKYNLSCTHLACTIDNGWLEKIWNKNTSAGPLCTHPNSGCNQSLPLGVLLKLWVNMTARKSRSINRTVAWLWCRRAKLEITRSMICNTEYQDELIHLISECTCTVRQRDRFKNHILPSYDMVSCLI